MIKGLPVVGGHYWFRRSRGDRWKLVRLGREGYWASIETFGTAYFESFFSDEPGLDLGDWEWAGPLMPPEG